MYVGPGPRIAATHGMDSPVTAIHDALLSISPKQPFEVAVQALKRHVSVPGRALLPAWRWRTGNTSTTNDIRLGRTDLDCFNQQLLGATLVQSLSWLAENARELWQEQKASLQKQSAGRALASGSSSQPPPAAGQCSMSTSASDSREGLHCAIDSNSLLGQALDLVYLFVDLLYAAAAAEADAVWQQQQQQQQQQDLQQAAAMGARSFQQLADAGDLAFTLSTTCQLLASLAPSVTGASLLDLVNAIVKICHFLQIWTRSCLYEDREGNASSSNPMTARQVHNQATKFVMILSDSGLPAAAAEGLAAVLEHLPGPGTPGMVTTSSPAAAGGGSEGQGGGSHPAGAAGVEGQEGGSGSSSGGGRSGVEGHQEVLTSSSSGGSAREAAGSSSTGHGGDPEQAADSSGPQTGMDTSCYELALQGGMLLLSAVMDHMGHHLLKAGLALHNDLTPLSDCPEVVEQMQVMDTLAAPSLVQLHLVLLATQQYKVRVTGDTQEPGHLPPQQQQQQQQQQRLDQQDAGQQQQQEAKSGDPQGRLQAAQQPSRQQQQKKCPTTAVPAYCQLYLEQAAPGLWSTLCALPPAARGAWLGQCLAEGGVEGPDTSRRQLNQLRVVLAVCDQFSRELPLDPLGVALLLEVCDTQALSHRSTWRHTEWLILMHALALLSLRHLISFAVDHSACLLGIVQRCIDAAAVETEAVVESGVAVFARPGASSSKGRGKGGAPGMQTSAEAQLQSDAVLNCEMVMQVVRACAGSRQHEQDVPGRTWLNKGASIAVLQQVGIQLLQQQEARCRLPCLLKVRVMTTLQLLPYEAPALLPLLSSRQGQRALLGAVTSICKNIRVLTAALSSELAVRAIAASSSSNRDIESPEMVHAMETLEAAGSKGELLALLADKHEVEIANDIAGGLGWVAFWTQFLLSVAAALLTPEVRRQVTATPGPPGAEESFMWRLLDWLKQPQTYAAEQYATLLAGPAGALQVVADQVVAAAAGIGARLAPDAALEAAEVVATATGAAQGGKPAAAGAAAAGAPSQAAAAGPSGDSSGGPTPQEVEVATTALVVAARAASLLAFMPERSAWMMQQLQPMLVEQHVLAKAAALDLPRYLRYATAWVLQLRPLLSGLLPPASQGMLQVLGDKWAAAGNVTRVSFKVCDTCTDEEFGLTAQEQSWVLAAAGCVVVPNQPGCWNPKCCNLSGLSEADLVTMPCSGCRQARYCSRACLKVHWKSGHKATCKPPAPVPAAAPADAGTGSSTVLTGGVTGDAATAAAAAAVGMLQL